MAKITSSVSLEKDIWDEIIKYQNKYDLSSRNVALERMLLERRMLLQIKDIPKNENVIKKIPNENINNDLLNESINNTFANMPE
ncbi:hypothetical protein [Clostridium sp.]|uniref:hypothetical protein n=1 Tax=Clostridium sp. TaxID=1506 RepID=UPI002635E513|nr:hypothetical protein [Clostridium sp.]